MNKTTVSKMILGAVLLLFTACTQDELAEQGCTLPDGEYPLQIGSVTLDVESNAEPWSAEGPQTRVMEDNTDGKSSVWEWNGSEMIGVRLGNETATYTLNVGPSLAPDRQLYWTSTDPAPVTAWYPANETVDLSDQSNGLVYVLKAEAPNATYDNEITLGFKHQLAKVRVVLNGTQAFLVQSVEVYGCTTCTNNEGAPIAGDTQGWLKMKHTTYTDGTECWEANVVPGTITLDNFVRINGQTATVNDGFPTTLDASTMYTLNLTVGQPITEITPGNVPTISDDGHYRISCTLEEAVTITGGKPTIYLENAQISVSGGNAINITSGNPTIHVKGNDNEVSSGNGAGIYVAENSSVTITGRSREDVLTARGGNGGNGIGGYTTISGHTATSTNSGNISVSNVTVYAYGSDYNADVHAPGIGGAGSASCGTITIDNATVYAYGTGESYYNVTGAAIGGGINADTKGSYSTITIENGSEVYVQRGNFRSDYIGHSGSTNNPATATDGIDAMVDETSTVTKLN